MALADLTVKALKEPGRSKRYSTATAYFSMSLRKERNFGGWHIVSGESKKL